MGIVLFSTSHQYQTAMCLWYPLFTLNAKGLSEYPGVPEYSLKPFAFKVKTRVTRDGFRFHFQNYLSNILLCDGYSPRYTSSFHAYFC